MQALAMIYDAWRIIRFLAREGLLELEGNLQSAIIVFTGGPRLFRAKQIGTKMCTVFRQVDGKP